MKELIFGYRQAKAFERHDRLALHAGTQGGVNVRDHRLRLTAPEATQRFAAGKAHWAFAAGYRLCRCRGRGMESLRAFRGQVAAES